MASNPTKPHLTRPHLWYTIPWMVDLVTDKTVLVYSSHSLLVEGQWGPMARHLDVATPGYLPSASYDLVVVDGGPADHLLAVFNAVDPKGGALVWRPGSDDCHAPAPAPDHLPYITQVGYYIGPAIVSQSIHPQDERRQETIVTREPDGHLWVYASTALDLEGTWILDPGAHPFGQLIELPRPDSSLSLGTLLRDNMRLAAGYPRLEQRIRDLENQLQERDQQLADKSAEAEAVWKERGQFLHELEAIYHSRAWKLVERYSQFMEHHPVGRRIKHLRGKPS